MNEINEETSLTLTLQFIDENGDPAIPDTAEYTIYNLTEDKEITSKTDVTIDGTTGTIQITTEENIIQNQGNGHEIQVVTIKWTYSTSKGVTKEYRYRINNLNRIGGDES